MLILFPASLSLFNQCVYTYLIFFLLSLSSAAFNPVSAFFLSSSSLRNLLAALSVHPHFPSPIHPSVRTYNLPHLFSFSSVKGYVATAGQAGAKKAAVCEFVSSHIWSYCLCVCCFIFHDNGGGGGVTCAVFSRLPPKEEVV